MHNGVLHYASLSLLALACRTPSVPAKSRVDGSPVAIAAPALRVALEQAVGARKFDSLQVRFSVDTLRSVLGVTYVWGAYLGIQHYNVLSTAVAAVDSRSVAVLQSPEDWSALAAGRPWHPESASSATSGCGEAIRVTGVRRHPSQRAFVFDGREKLPLFFRSQPETIPPEAESPQVTARSEGWLVTLWVVEVGAVTKYRCSTAKSGRVTLEEERTFPGKGHPVLQP
jgi:hypothetical protein